MRREVRLLRGKALDSLILSIEHFNRPDDRGRASTVLILLDHAFEMLLKASILHRGGRIRDKKARETLGFDACVRKALSDALVKFLSEEQALTLQMINGLRDAAQHHLIDISEGQFYLHVQTGVTLFRDLLKAVFNEDLSTKMPARVLPISTVAPLDITMLYETETEEIKKLLAPKKRRRTEAYARLRPLAIFDATILGQKIQPSVGELQRKGDALLAGKTWQDTFIGASSVELTTDPTAPAISLRITKKEGIPVQLVPEGTPGASVVAVRRVDELGYYNLGAKQIAEKLSLTIPKVVAIVEYLRLRKNPELYKEFRIGKAIFKRYSPKAVEAIRSCLESTSIDKIWRALKRRKLS
jgi:hypothetical protein